MVRRIKRISSNNAFARGSRSIFTLLLAAVKRKTGFPQKDSESRAINCFCRIQITFRARRGRALGGVFAPFGNHIRLVDISGALLSYAPAPTGTRDFALIEFDTTILARAVNKNIAEIFYLVSCQR